MESVWCSRQNLPEPIKAGLWADGACLDFSGTCRWTCMATGLADAVDVLQALGPGAV